MLIKVVYVSVRSAGLWPDCQMIRQGQKGTGRVWDSSLSSSRCFRAGAGEEIQAEGSQWKEQINHKEHAEVVFLRTSGFWDV